MRKTEVQRKRVNNKTKKRYGGKNKLSNFEKSKIVKNFIAMLNTVKLYHWRTDSFAQHKATDELYAKLNENIDSFVEILMGKDESRIKQIDKKIDLVDCSNVGNFKQNVYEYRDFLIELTDVLDAKKDTDLLNIRDELLGNINQLLYLLTLNK